jgi:uncharacterized protein YqgC (DUF456 family)
VTAVDMTVINLLVGLAILVGLVGIVVPVLPGVLLVWAAVLVWALLADGTARWLVLAVVTVLIAVSQVVKYLVPHRRMRRAGVPTRTLVSGVAFAVVGFFVIPVVGAIVGFVLGVYLAERLRLDTHAAAWPSAKHAIKAVGLAILIELAAGLLAAGTWIAGVIATT